MAHNLKYSMRVWLTGGILAPLLFPLLFPLIERSPFDFTSEDIAFIVVYCLVGLLCSIPSLLVLWLVVTLLGRSDSSVAVKKMILIILTGCLLLISFYFFPGGGLSAVESPGTELFIAYFIAICGGLLYYRIEEVTSPDNMGEENIVS